MVGGFERGGVMEKEKREKALRGKFVVVEVSGEFLGGIDIVSFWGRWNRVLERFLWFR